MKQDAHDEQRQTKLQLGRQRSQLWYRWPRTHQRGTCLLPSYMLRLNFGPTRPRAIVFLNAISSATNSTVPDTFFAFAQQPQTHINANNIANSNAAPLDQRDLSGQVP